MRNDIVVNGTGSQVCKRKLGGVFPNGNSVVVGGDFFFRIEADGRGRVGGGGNLFGRRAGRTGIEIRKRKILRHIYFDGRTIVVEIGQRLRLAAQVADAGFDPLFGGCGSIAQSGEIVVRFGFDGVDVSLRLREAIICQDRSPLRENMSERHVR